MGNLNVSDNMRASQGWTLHQLHSQGVLPTDIRNICVVGNCILGAKNLKPATSNI